MTSREESHRRKLAAGYIARGESVPPQLQKSIAHIKPPSPPEVISQCYPCQQTDHEDCKRAVSRNIHDCRCWICYGAEMYDRAREMYPAMVPGKAREAVADLIALCEQMADANPS